MQKLVILVNGTNFFKRRRSNWEYSLFGLSIKKIKKPSETFSIKSGLLRLSLASIISFYLQIIHMTKASVLGHEVKITRVGHQSSFILHWTTNLMKTDKPEYQTQNDLHLHVLAFGLFVHPAIIQMLFTPVESDLSVFVKIMYCYLFISTLDSGETVKWWN